MDMQIAEMESRAHQFVEGLRTHNWDLFRSIMSADVHWTLPGTSLISGNAKGIDAVIERAQRIVSYGLGFKLDHLLTGLHGTALALHNSGTRGGLVLDEYLTVVFIFKDERIIEIHSYMSDVNAVNAFFV